ncbi:redox-sensing transcriptional repressor Rex [Caproiciproducens sp. NJN-50]|uniref:redox-sensing transcriptional repressor Rex n=1 Tax=Acutalibacteraceae TaxID=3082771 RepID=UPI000FFE1CC8|nr:MULTISPECIES: redox-sensing transcriptional repressor Rex [Acutalibacteraceae]QAT49803.1 redox-sensing transcriptional repressor Rex [Caproiciproducens sp. NJN-50]
MPRRENVSMSVIRRLPRYYRFLSHLKDKGVTRISSTELSAKLGLTASQIRQDLNCFGGFGQQGYGYIVSQLCDEIANILSLASQYPTVLFGAGNLGRAIGTHMSFEMEGFHLIGIFDSSPDRIGMELANLKVKDVSEMEEFCKKEKPVMAIFCLPPSAAAELAEKLYSLGIRNFWNFSHYDISMQYPDAIVENVHLNDSLMTLCYRISNKTLK